MSLSPAPATSIAAPAPLDPPTARPPDLVYAVVVARAGSGAKSRLSPVLSPAERHDLVLAMLADVLAACRATPEVKCLVVVTDAAVRDLTFGGAHAAPADAGRNAAA